MPLRRPIIASLLLTGVLALPAPALAGGFYLQEQSAIETGRALAGAGAAADDPSAIFFNPAAMTNLSGIQTSIGGSALMASAHQTNRGTNRTVPTLPGVKVPVTGNDGGNPFEKVIPIPSFYVTGQVTDRLWLGVGVNAPFGLKLKYDDGFFGRYDSLYTNLKTYNIQSSAAYKLNDNFSIGGGVDVQYVKATLTNALPQLSPLAPADGFARLKGDDWSVGWNAGLFYTNGATNVGVSYRSGIKHKLTGTQTISGLLGPIAAANSALDASAPLDLPDIVTVGFMHRLTPNLRAMISGRWYNWSKFKGIAITSAAGTSNKELDYKDSYSVSLGGEYDVSPALTLRAGTMFDRTPTNAQHLTTRVPDGDRAWLTGGATFNISPAFALNVSYAHTFVEKANIVRPDSYYPTPATVTATTLAQTSGNADQVAASLTARF
ncbi:OmpP1/FadL family transporter [Sphingobium chungbukense]|uniref:Long-chain fatty acid transporter n=1 Tax=Sphingobium chungbukense TaxID=56193 RepID=A0A0M3ATW9_9SPHN|nr:outer membrane protein transport protein [Sphingobium chungbukense]KKW93642.1 long-chain fatty acid transporter [Sphingobium chungbukense]